METTDVYKLIKENNFEEFERIYNSIDKSELDKILYSSVFHKRLNFIDLLLIDKGNETKTLIYSCILADYDIVKYLFEKYEIPNLERAINICSKNHRSDILNLLLKKHNSDENRIIPSWILKENMNQNCSGIPLYYLKENSSVNNLEEFIRVLRICEYWKINLVDDLYEYCKNNRNECLNYLLRENKLNSETEEKNNLINYCFNILTYNIFKEEQLIILEIKYGNFTYNINFLQNEISINEDLLEINIKNLTIKMQDNNIFICFGENENNVVNRIFNISYRGFLSKLISDLKLLE